MQTNKEINALLTLMDDPDEEVYATVSNKIVDYGNEIIPNLEDLWESTLNDTLQVRIEMVIHRLHFTDLKNDLIAWRDSAYPDLLCGALLAAKFQYPDLQSSPVLQDIEKMRRTVWLELNNFLTPLEQANVLSSILYKYFKLSGDSIDHNRPDDFCINKVLQTKKGNAITNGIIYQVLCELLDINARLINIPNQSIIAFYQSDIDPFQNHLNPQENIHFYVDSISGQAYSHIDIETYFTKIQEPLRAVFFKPLTHLQIIKQLLNETSKCFNTTLNTFKKEELLNLSALLD
jgi:regulator of sirC expression with transglutaminase-like and TPR domain